MVATFARLRLTLLRNTLLREKWRIILLVIGALYGLGLLLAAVSGLALLNAADDELRRTILVIGGSLLVLSWVVVPVIAFGVDNTLDPQRFALYLNPDRRFAVALLVAGAVSIPAAVTIVVCLATAVAWVRSASPGQSVLLVILALIAGLLAAVLCLLLARVTTTAAAGVMRGRRGRDAAGLLGVLAVLALALLPSIAQSVSWRLSSFNQLVDVLVWTPFGAPWAIPADAAAGQWGLVVARFAIVGLTLALAFVAYQRLLVSSMTSVGTGSTSGVDRSSRLPFAHALMARGVPAPIAAVAGRAVTYWRGDPRYLASGASILLMPALAVVFAFLISSQEDSGVSLASALGWVALVAAPLAAWIGAWSLHDDVAYDSSAFWMHVSSGMSGRADRIGRIIGMSIWLVPLTVILAIVAPAAANRADMIPAVLGLSLAMLGAGFGASSVLSVVLPYPVPPPGANPMQTEMSSFGITFLAQIVSSVVIGLLVLPTALTLILVFASNPAWGWLTLIVGLVSAAAWLLLGIRIGAKRFEQRQVAVLTTIRSWPKH